MSDDGTVGTTGGGGHERVPDVLTAFQVEVIGVFFTLPESEGFLLAGGAALVAQGLTSRPTRDVDFFTGPGQGVVAAARDGLLRESARLGWSVELIHDQSSFCRLVLTRSPSREKLLVDLAVDSTPGRPPIDTELGPSFAPNELAGRKIVALFDRAEARDFADVFALVQRFGKGPLLRWAGEVDDGFDIAIFAQMLATLNRFTDSDLPAPSDQAPILRAFFAEWIAELQRR